MISWGERFRDGEYPYNREPSPALDQSLSEAPNERVPHVANGTGRYVMFLAAEGYEADAMANHVGIRIMRENAAMLRLFRSNPD